VERREQQLVASSLLGENLIAWDADNSSAHRPMGPLPPLGRWLRLEVPAAAVGLEGRELNGMAFTLFGGRASWDRAGKISAQPASAARPGERYEIVWFEDLPPKGATTYVTAAGWPLVSRDPTPRDGSFVRQSPIAPGTNQQILEMRGETVWIDDQLPPGAVARPSEEPWQWVSQNPAPLFGSVAHQSAILPGQHQHYFEGATPIAVGPGDTLFAHVYLDPANPPSEIMLQWNDGGSWSHRAYWGANLIDWDVDRSPARRFMGPLPPAGRWVRLEVPARLVALEGRTMNGMAFTHFDGRATWDRAGVATQQPTLRVAKGDVLFADVFLDPDNTPREVMLQWNEGTWEHRAYWGANLIGWGIDGTVSRRAMGALPKVGEWVRLKVAAADVGLEGREVRAMAFTLFDGRAAWNRAGLLTVPLAPAVFFPAL
jgi:hypothetical protein